MHNAECIISEVPRTWIYKAPHKTSFHGVTSFTVEIAEKRTTQGGKFGCRNRFSPPKPYFVYCEWGKQCRIHNAECIISEVLRTWIYKAPHKTSFHGVTSFTVEIARKCTHQGRQVWMQKPFFSPEAVLCVLRVGKKRLEKQKSPALHFVRHKINGRII